MITLVTDLDGTVAFDGRRPDRDIRLALEELAASGAVRVVLATARTHRCIESWFGAFGRQVDLLCCNGALTVLGGRSAGTAPRAVVRRTIAPAAVAEVVDRLSRAGAHYCLEYGPWFAATSAHSLPWWGREHRRVLSPGELPVLDGVVKVTLEKAGPWAQEFAGLDEVDVFPHETGDMDLVARGVDKAVALAELLDASVDRDPVVALGNDRNDLALLCGADRAFLVGEGLPGLEGLAYVTRVPAVVESVASVLRDSVVVGGITHGSSSRNGSP